MDDVAPGRLVVVASTPDRPTVRADEVLAVADGVVTGAEADAGSVVDEVAGGATVALLASGPTAATAAVVAAVVDAGLLVEVAPAPDRAVAALVASGLPTDRFAVDPALPPTGPERGARLADLAGERRTTVLPAIDVASDRDAVAAACGPDRPVVVVDDHLVVGGAAEVVVAADDEAVVAALRAARARGVSPSRAAAEVAAVTGRPRREVYALGAEDDTDADIEDGS